MAFLHKHVPIILVSLADILSVNNETSVLARAESYIEIQSQMEHALAQD